MSEPYDSDYQKRIAKRLAKVPPYVPARPKREEFCCPNCGLNGDHMKVPISDQRCKGCCTTDAAPDLLDALRALTVWVGATAELLATLPRPQGGGHSRTLLDAIEGGRAWVRAGSDAQEAIAKAEGRAK